MYGAYTSIALVCDYFRVNDYFSSFLNSIKKRNMYLISGGNIFGQWLSNSHIFNDFTQVSFDKDIKSSAKLKCISWSYNILKDDEEFYITGAFKTSDNVITKLKLPGKYESKNNSILIGNDEYLMYYDNNNNKFWKLRLNEKRQWNWKRVPNFIKTLEASGTKRKKTEEIIVKAVTKNNVCVCLTSSGAVYEIPNKIDTSYCDGVICDVVCGYDHTVALTSNGVVYTWGDGGRCQLGHGDLGNLEEPKAVEGLLGIKITKIAAGGWHTLALSDSGDLYTWGWNESSQLGITGKNDANLPSTAIPVVVDFYDKNGEITEINVKDIAGGSRHSAILDSNNSIWTTGKNNYGQLGLDPEKNKCLKKYVKVLDLNKDCSLSCGPWATVITL